jgi:two-component system chemotaxis response regulator CheY
MGFITHPALPFLIVSDNISWMVMGLVPPEMSESQLALQMDYGEKYIYDMTFDVNKIRFETSNTDVMRYFDYSHLLCKTFNVNPSLKNGIEKLPWAIDELKRNERTIINSLINDSNPSDFQRSQNIGISHPTITKIRKSLINRGIIKTIVKPNLNTFEYTIFAWFNIKLEGKSIDKNLLNTICCYPNNILSIHDNNNIFILSIFYKMKDLMVGQQKVDEFMSSAMISYENIVFNYFSMENPSFVLKTRTTPATEIFSDLPKEETKETISMDYEDEICSLFLGFLSTEETKSITDAIKTGWGSNGQKRTPSENLMSMILELLTEPRYLSSLEGTKRMTLQARLIERLNSLRGMIETTDNFASDIKRKRVLIVEDSRAMVELLKDIFNEANLDVVGAVEDGQSAFDLYKKLAQRNKKPDIVLMDVFIKGINGIEASRMIKNFDPTASIIVLTSSLDSRIKNQMTALGVDEYLIKPVTKSQLLDSIKQTISNRRG